MTNPPSATFLHQIMPFITFLVLLLLPTINMAQDFVPGTTYYDENNYVEYLAGNLPIVISAPHGGYLEPDNIPDRKCAGCSYIRDAYTQELAREIQAAYFAETGCYPHIVINLLHRKKFDANRSITTAADGNATVEQSWYAYHDFLDAAKTTISSDYGRGLFLDLHGHGHEIQRIELGYGLSRSELQMEDNDLDEQEFIEESSIRSLVTDNLQAYSHAELLRGNYSFGTLLEEEGFAAVPSIDDPFPLNDEPYFSGGYNTLRHGSLEGGPIDGIQIECNQNIRFNESTRQHFAAQMPSIINDYITTHYNDAFAGNYCELLVNTDLVPETPTIQLYPNPAHKQLQIISAFDELNIIIYNSSGTRIEQQLWTGKPLNLDHLANGIYLLVLQKDGLRLQQTTLIKM